MEEYLKNSNWIWGTDWSAQDKDCPRIMLFRRAVSLAEEPFEAQIKISADTRYKLYVNAHLVEIGPSRGDHQVWFYDDIDILPYLNKGMNVIAVSVLRYPEEPVKGNHGMFRTSVPGLYVTGLIRDMAGTEYGVSADASWKCRIDKNVVFYREEERFAPLMIHEKAAGSPALAGWKKAGYVDSGWQQARPYIKKLVPQAVSPGNLKPRNIPYMYRKKGGFRNVMDLKKSNHTLEEWNAFLRTQGSKEVGQGQKTLTIPAHTQTIVELDAGEEMTGYMHVSFWGGKGAEISLLYSEAYVQDGFAGPEHIPVKADRMDKENGHLQGYEDIYLAAGFGNAEEPEVYEPYWFRTFRFLRLHIETADEEITLCGLDYEETGYPLQAVSSVQTSDPSLQPIWEISERTLRRCMHETYEDCPFYEQLQYIMDARAQILYTYAVSADDRLARKCMDDFRRSQRYDGLLNCSYPNCNTNVIPGFMAERAATATRRCTVNPLIGTYTLLAKKAGVEIRTNTEVTKEYALKENADALIIAVGSGPLIPPLPGIDGDNVVIVNNYYLEKDKVGDDVVVFGGGLAGCECAIHLGIEGKQVHLVEMRDELAPDANVRHRPLLLAEIEKYVTVHTGRKGLEVTADGILCEDKDGNKELVPGRSVICALGQRSRTDVVEELRGAAPYVAVIGDAAKVSTITNAVYWGYYAALDI